MKNYKIGFVAFREGSKRFKLKNGRCLGNKTLYQITLEKLIKLKRKGLLDEVVASTDCLKWQNHVAELWPNDVIIHERSKEISGDNVNEGAVILDFLNRNEGYKRAHVLLTLCTYPLLKIEVIKKVVDEHKKKNCNVFGIKEAHHMPQKLLKLTNDGFIRPYLCDSMDEFETNTKLLKESFPVSYYSTGVFMIHHAYQQLSVSFDLWKNNHIIGVNDDSLHVDIDTEEDLRIADAIYRATETK